MPDGPEKSREPGKPRGPGKPREPGGPGKPPAAALPHAEIARVFREEYDRAVSVLVGAIGDVDLAEESVQDAFATASERWPAAGPPPGPAGWILTTARNRAVDRLRREATRADRRVQAAALSTAAAEDGEPEEGPVRAFLRLRRLSLPSDTLG